MTNVEEYIMNIEKSVARYMELIERHGVEGVVRHLVCQIAELRSRLAYIESLEDASPIDQRHIPDPTAEELGLE